MLQNLNGLSCYSIGIRSFSCPFLVADVGCLDLSCGRNFTLFVREDISEMEVAAKKFEMEAGTMGEINQQAKSGDGLYSYPSLNISSGIEDGYFPYCTIKPVSIPTFGDTAENESQELEPVSRIAPMLNSGTISLNSDVSETSTSCVALTLCSLAEPLESASASNNVRYSSLLIGLALSCVS